MLNGILLNQALIKMNTIGYCNEKYPLSAHPVLKLQACVHIVVITI